MARRSASALPLLALALLFFAGCAARRPPEIGAAPGATQEGVASWYGPGFHGNATASGEVYDQDELTAAHRTLPLGTRAMVTNLDNRRSVEVRINDRGPFAKDRVIDLSRAAARAVGMIGPGTARVRIEVLDRARGGFPAVAYAVQVGAFADAGNARRLKERIDPRFDRVYLATLETGGSRYHRVRIGPFGRREDALAAARRAASLGLQAMVTEEDRVRP